MWSEGRIQHFRRHKKPPGTFLMPTSVTYIFVLLLAVSGKFFQSSTALEDHGQFTEVPLSHSDTRHSVGPCGRVICPTHIPQRNKKHSQEKYIQTPGRIRTRNPSKRAAADPRLRRRCCWDAPSLSIYELNMSESSVLL